MIVMNNTLISSPETLVNYLREFALSAESGAKGFVYGGSRKLQEFLRNVSEEEYPVLHFERPNIHNESSDANHEEWYWCSLNCYAKFRTDGEPAENDASELLAERVALDVLRNLQKQMHHDARRGILEYSIDGNSKDPILDNFLANHLGWQLNFRIGFNSNVNLC